MSCLRSCRTSLSPILSSFADSPEKMVLMFSVAIFFAVPCRAQEEPSVGQISDSRSAQKQAQPTVTIPAGTSVSLVLTQPIQSRYVRRGDEIFAQVLSPVDAENQVIIPAGTFVQGAIDKFERRSRQGELRLESLSITFPDGYVAPIAGPITLQSDEGYALKDPGGKRMAGAFLLPAAGAGVGALIGHSVGSSQSTLTSSLPPGCTGPPPYCVSSSMTVPGSAGMDTAIGAGVGAAAGMIASLTLLFGSHHFYLVAGAPIQMTLQQPVTLPRDEVAKAVRKSIEHPAQVPPVAPLPVYLPPYPDNGIPAAPAPGPPTVIPGPPGPNGIPGPPIVIPGTPQ
jgi:hypothetical protein